MALWSINYRKTYNKLKAECSSASSFKGKGTSTPLEISVLCFKKWLMEGGSSAVLSSLFYILLGVVLQIATRSKETQKMIPSEQNYRLYLWLVFF